MVYFFWLSLYRFFILQNLTRFLPSHSFIKAALFTILLVVFHAPSILAQTKAPSVNLSRNLILSDKYQEHFLSPYVTRYYTEGKELDLTDILNTQDIRKENYNFSGSILPLPSDDATIWLSFDIVNRSSKAFWYIDFGNSAMGRFGLFNMIESYSFNHTDNDLIKNKLTKDKTVMIDVPINQKSTVILRMKLTHGTPATLPLRLIHEDHAPSFRANQGFYIILALLIGMVFFFGAVALSRSNQAYLLFSAFYMMWGFLLFIQNNFIVFNVTLFDKTLLASDVIPLTLLIIGILGLLTARLFWNVQDSTKLSKAVFCSLIAFSILGFLSAYFLPFNIPYLKTTMLYTPSIFLFTLVPVISIIQSQQGREEATPFMFGWFICLFGVFISALSLGNFIQPVSSGINAVWYSLLPQAMFFMFAIYIKSKKENTERTYSKTFEIDETESLSRLRQSKENTEQSRLLKVIEQERKVLGELRKSEARRTEQMRKAKENADAANRQKSAFLAVVSHEIRTPMTGIMGMVRMLLDSNLTKEQKEYAQTIQDSSDAMLALLNDILDFEKIEEGKMTFENISFDINRLVQGVVTLMKGHAKQKDIKLLSKIDDDLPRYVRGDPNRLRQVLLNLTGNAVKFTNEGSVTLSVQLVKERSEEGNYEIYFGVADSGIGISKEAQKNLFKPFSQADSSISRKFGGTGLGLAISKGVVEAMGSSININSDEGNGSTFFFTLNMKQGQSRDAVNNAQPVTASASDQKSLRVLIVDDNDINQKVVAGFLEKDKYILDKAYDAETAIEKTKDNEYDIILMDIQLPKMKGDEAAQVIRQSNQDIPIIALTGNLMGSDIEKYEAAGMNGYLEKPIDPNKLKQTLQSAGGGVKEDRKKPVIEQAPTEVILNPETLNTLKGHLGSDDIKEMIRDLMTKSNEIIMEIQTALSEQDKDALYQRGHEMKGMAGNFGLIELSKQAGEIETKAKADKAILVLTALGESLPEMQKRAETALGAWINKNAE